MLVLAALAALFLPACGPPSYKDEFGSCGQPGQPNYPPGGVTITERDEGHKLTVARGTLVVVKLGFSHGVDTFQGYEPAATDDTKTLAPVSCFLDTSDPSRRRQYFAVSIFRAGQPGVAEVSSKNQECGGNLRCSKVSEFKVTVAVD
jgi:hypothetical protein